MEGSGTVDVYQGVVYVWPSLLETSSMTVVLPRSHKEVWPRIIEDKLAEYAGHYMELSFLRDKALSEELLQHFGRHARRVPVPAGGMMLWNSR
jgi:hypothetical protein